MVNEAEELRVSKVEIALQKLEESSELVLISSNIKGVARTILDSLGPSLGQSVSEKEIMAILNSINAVLNGVKVDDFDFSTIIGMDKNELALTFEKLEQWGQTELS